MPEPVLDPVSLEIRAMGTLPQDQLAGVSRSIPALKSSGKIRPESSWNEKAARTWETAHHWDVAGYKLVAMTELGTLTAPLRTSTGSGANATVQVYANLNPCFQAWVRADGFCAAADGGRAVSWPEIRELYGALIELLEDLSLDARSIVWSVTLLRPEQVAGAGSVPTGAISDTFFQRVLGVDVVDYEAASWIGSSFVGVCRSEGVDHHLVVDLDRGRPYRMSSLLYILDGKLKMHDLEGVITAELTRGRREGVLSGKETPPLRVSLETGRADEEAPEDVAGPAPSHPDKPEKIADAQEAVNQNIVWEARLERVANTLEEHIVHGRGLREFLRYHLAQLLDQQGGESPCAGTLPPFGASLRREIQAYHEGPLDEVERWAREEVRRTKEDLETEQKRLRGTIEILLQREVRTTNILIVGLTVATIVIGVLTLLRV